MLNKPGMDHKVVKIVCLSVIGDTLSQDNYNNLHLLGTRAPDWVIAQFDELCSLLTSELEPKSNDELLAMDAVTYERPEADDVHKSRRAL